MVADGLIRAARAQGVERRHVRGRRVRRSVRVHANPAPAQELPEAQDAHGRVLRHIPGLHRGVRVLVRQLVARRLGSHGHGDRQPAAGACRVPGPGHMHNGLHTHPAQHHCSSHSHAH